METLVPLIISIGLSFLIASTLGVKRKIGFGWSLFFCIIFSPIIGLVITMVSRKTFEHDTNK